MGIVSYDDDTIAVDREEATVNSNLNAASVNGLDGQLARSQNRQQR